MMKSSELRHLLREGMVIPAHPLALTPERRLDERRQRCLTRYYMDAGAGGLAVGVHTTQFAIRSPEHRLFRPVLALAAEEMSAWESRKGTRTVKIAGAVGPTAQALEEAETAQRLGGRLLTTAEAMTTSSPRVTCSRGRAKQNCYAVLCARGGVHIETGL